MKIALLHDSLLVCAGSERVFLSLIEEFNEADIFTLAYNPKTTCPQFIKYNINTSWVNKLISSHERFKIAFPLCTYVMQYWNFSDYDLIISSSATTAKYIAKFEGQHICFGYYPTRAIWDTNAYFSDNNIKGIIFRIVKPYLKSRDLQASKRVSQFIAQSKVSTDAFKKYYGRNAPIIHSPINYRKFKYGLKEDKSDSFLIVSRLVHWKCIEYAIEAFNSIKKPLTIIGTGEDEIKLKEMANENIIFLGNICDEQLKREYGKARALIFTPELEYGLTPLEANAAGTPVIAYGKGAINETMIPYLNDDQISTAVFFHKQTPDSLINALKKFEKITFNRQKLSKHASKFSQTNFKKKIRNYVSGYMENMIVNN